MAQAPQTNFDDVVGAIAIAVAVIVALAIVGLDVVIVIMVGWCELPASCWQQSDSTRHVRIALCRVGSNAVRTKQHNYQYDHKTYDHNQDPNSDLDNKHQHSKKQNNNNNNNNNDDDDDDDDNDDNDDDDDEQLMMTIINN